MVESLLEWLSLHADQAHYIIFGLLVVTGLSVPISEDAMLIVSGILASTVIPDHTLHLFLGVFLGCFASDCIAYGLGRHFGKRLTRSRWSFFSLSESRVRRLNVFYKRYGFWTLFVGRFIPFGVRNGIFMTAGAGKMAFSYFALVDGISCLIFSSIVFFASYSCAQNYESVQYFMHHGGRLLLLAVCIAVASFVGLKMWRRRYGVARKTV
jgi:membrane protein DedA with SNARE-associated domain